VTTGPVGGVDVTLGRGGSVAGPVVLPDGFDPADVQVARLAPGLPAVETSLAADGTGRCHPLVPAT